MIIWRESWPHAKEGAIATQYTATHCNTLQHTATHCKSQYHHTHTHTYTCIYLHIGRYLSTYINAVSLVCGAKVLCHLCIPKPAQAHCPLRNSSLLPAHPAKNLAPIPCFVSAYILYLLPILERVCVAVHLFRVCVCLCNK